MIIRFSLIYVLAWYLMGFVTIYYYYIFSYNKLCIDMIVRIGILYIVYYYFIILYTYLIILILQCVWGSLQITDTLKTNFQGYSDYYDYIGTFTYIILYNIQLIY